VRGSDGARSQYPRRSVGWLTVMQGRGSHLVDGGGGAQQRGRGEAAYSDM
jgi:hypothetical protein